MLKWPILQQLIGVVIFFGTIFYVGWTSAVLIGTVFIERVVRKRPYSLKRAQWVLLAVAFAGVLCILYGFFVEPYELSVETVHLTSPKLRPDQAPIRIVQISDLHCDPTPRLEEKLPGVIAALHPDVIAFTGDAINSPAGLPVFRKCITSLAKIAPTYAVKGNWDAWYFKKLDRFGGTGATELTGTPAHLVIRGQDIWLSGLPVGTTGSVQGALTGVPDNAYKIFLFHYPDYIKQMLPNHIDLYLAGHTHGGQVALPLYGAIITLAETGKQYEHGLYHEGSTYLYVNRGIGMEGGKAPRVRFCAVPEVTVIEVLGETSAAAR